ncbi:MAG: VOC family protein [Eubacteriales bacterium]|nr:VOC family protein [Eubacteriales bacterium]
MTGAIVHVGITVRDMERALHFYRDILGLTFEGEMVMAGPETDTLFQEENVRVRVAYLNGGKNIHCPPVELLCFDHPAARPHRGSLTEVSIAEICFDTDDIDAAYHHLISCGTECLSPPQTFDLSDQGFGVSRAFYFRDPDGNVLEYIQSLSDESTV